MEKILIVDGNNLLFQMFYGMPSKIYNKKGETIHATIGFISALLRQIKMVKATKVMVVFDGDITEERIELLEDYKANRITNWDELPADEVPFHEEEKIIRCLDYLQIKHITSKNMEADDLIASCALEYARDNEVIISSFDSDFFQLISHNISVMRYRGSQTYIYTEETFYEKFQFRPSKYVFYKSLVGDHADNIKGLKGIGKVRATQLVNKYENYENILLDIGNVKPVSIQTALQGEKEVFYLNYQVIYLTKKDVSFFAFEECSFLSNLRELTNTEVLSANRIFEE